MDVRLMRVTAVLAVSQIAGWGTTFYLPGIIGRDMAADLGLSLGTTYAGITTMVIIGAVLSPRVGRALDRHGTRWFMAFGSVLMAVGLVLLSVTRGPALYFLAWSVIGVGSVLALSLPATTTLAHVAGATARRAMIGLMLFTGLSSSVIWPVTAVIEPLLGWRGTCAVYALVHLLLCLPLHVFGLAALPGPPLAAGEPATSQAPAVPAERAAKVFPALALSSAMSGFVSWGLSLHIIAILQVGGLSEGTAIALGSAMGFMQVGARLVDFMLGNRVTPLVPAVAATALLPVSFAIFYLGFGWPAATVIFLVTYAVATGLIAVARATLPLWLFGPAVYGTTSGRLTMAQNIAFGVAPVIYATVMEFGLRWALLLALVSAFGSFLSMASVARGVRG